MTHQAARLAPGDLAPEFALPDADGVTFSSASLRGRRFVVYFYPAALTPGCTTQACDFRDNLAAFQRANVDVVGVSPDKPAKLARFRDEHGLTFPLLADERHDVLTAFGAYGEKTMYGKKVTGVIRSTIVVGADGNIEKALYNVKATGHVDKLLRDLDL